MDAENYQINIECQEPTHRRRLCLGGNPKKLVVYSEVRYTALLATFKYDNSKSYEQTVETDSLRCRAGINVICFCNKRRDATVYISLGAPRYNARREEFVANLHHNVFKDHKIKDDIHIVTITESKKVMSLQELALRAQAYKLMTASEVNSLIGSDYYFTQFARRGAINPIQQALLQPDATEICEAFEKIGHTRFSMNDSPPTLQPNPLHMKRLIEKLGNEKIISIFFDKHSPSMYFIDPRMKEKLMTATPAKQ